MTPKRFPMPPNLIDRWWLRVDRNGPNGCWLWTGATWARGYGKFTMPGTQKRVAAHRWGYEQLVGPVPADYDIDHLCRVHACVNPAHLEPVPHAENVRRGIAGLVNGGRQRAVSHCPAGHAYDDANTYYRPDSPGRNCRACGAISAARRRKGHARERHREGAA